MTSQADKLRALLAEDKSYVMPCCYDGLSAKMIEQAGFPLTFMSGFAVSAVRLGLPDTGLISYGEMLDQARNISSAIDIPVIGDGDTGYGNALNIKRTVAGYAAAGMAAIMIEDQLSPKRCGHTKGKAVIGEEEAFDRIKAAVDARNEGADILILARTDARASLGLGPAIARAQKFAELGADILFVEAPVDEEEMAAICREVPGIHMANMVEGGTSPLLSPARLHELGFRIIAYPLTVLSAAMNNMRQALDDLKKGHHPQERLMSFEELRQTVGFNEYYEEENRYANPRT